MQAIVDPYGGVSGYVGGKEDREDVSWIGCWLGAMAQENVFALSSRRPEKKTVDMEHLDGVRFLCSEIVYK